MSTPTLKNNLPTLAQAAAYKAYLSLMPQIHHKTVNMSSGATSAKPLKTNHPLEYNELASKADELICMHFDSESNDKAIDKEEARKATRFAVDQLYNHLAPKHNNSSSVPANIMDNSSHTSPKESFSNYDISSTSSSDGSKRVSPNVVVAPSIIAPQHNSVPLHPTSIALDDSIPFERAVPGDAASDTQNLAIDSLPARIDETYELDLASLNIPSDEAGYPSSHIVDIHKIQPDNINHGLPESKNSKLNTITDDLNKDTSSYNDDTKFGVGKKVKERESSLLLEQSEVDNISASDRSAMGIHGGALDQLQPSNKNKENGNDSTPLKDAGSDDHERNTENDLKNNKKTALGRDVALASNGISALGLSSNILNQAPLKSQTNTNGNTGVDRMMGHKIRNKHSALAGYIGPKVIPDHKQQATTKNNTDETTSIPSFTNSGDADHRILKGNSNPDMTISF
ncbi:hypothetical protein K501DRAFT_331990 [Backusella circina FSU 941]|nr:hypothetical protein K501DRAFT_331990 [Backusella circina FSU 941]